MIVPLILGGFALLGAAITSGGAAAFAITGGRSDTAIGVAVVGLLLFLLAALVGAVLIIISSAMEVVS